MSGPQLVTVATHRKENNVQDQTKLSVDFLISVSITKVILCSPSRLVTTRPGPMTMSIQRTRTADGVCAFSVALCIFCC